MGKDNGANINGTDFNATSNHPFTGFCFNNKMFDE